MISIAIDGPSGAGKSTLSRRLAQTFGLIYVDTGALYRSIGLAVLRAGKDTKDAQQVAAQLADIHLALRHVDGEQRVFLGREDVSQAIREERVSMAASDVSAHGAVREFLLETQRRLARENSVIMDGRDIGTVVLPGADLKIFLTATVQDRAMRRWLQLKENDTQADLAMITKDVIQRDYNDTHRDIAPLAKAQDALEAVTTGLSFEQAFEKLKNLILHHLPQLKEKK